jgi:hypothetical protein
MPLAFIHWIGDGATSPPYPSQGLPPFPSNPIVVPPGGVWPSPPYPSQGLPPFPSNPIVVPPGGVWPQPPQPPDGFWGAGGNFPTNPIQLPPFAGGWQPRPDQGLPPFPSHPIVIPKPPAMANDPDYGIDEGTGYLRPSHPINLPPTVIVGGGYWLFVYIPGHGWEWISFKPGAPKPPEFAVPKAGEVKK